MGLLFLGVLALLCASVSRLQALVIPLSAFGVLMAGATVLLARVTRSPSLLAGAATALNGAVLLVAILLPGLLGPGYEVFRQQHGVDPAAIHVVPLPGHAEVAESASPDWVDASRAALRQGKLLVELTDASFVVADGPDQKKRGKGAPKKYLFIRLRVQRAGSGQEFGSQQWGGPIAWDRKVRLTLTDDSGKVYEQQSDYQGGDAAGLENRSSVFPVANADPLFVFEAPPPGIEFLRLEIPVEVWGGSGGFRFTIPKGMLRSEPVKAGRGSAGSN
jgi:hypothetical protein